MSDGVRELIVELRRIADALEALAHRDVKPENVPQVDKRPVGRPILTPKAAAAVERAVKRRRVG